MTITDAEVEAAEAAFYGVHERGFIMRPLIADENGRYDMRKALLAASQARALSSGEGWRSMEDFPADEQIVEVRRIGEPERWNAAKYRRHHDATADYMQWRRPQPPSKDNTNE